jgi:exodeoxyribonuclease VII large subunit
VAGASEAVGAQARRPLPPTAAETSAEQPWPVRLLTAKMADHVARMPTVWVEGQLVEITRRPGQATCYLTLRDPDVDMSLPVTAHARLLDALGDGIGRGARVVVRARPELWPKRGSFSLAASDIRPVGVGELLARIEHLKRVLAAEGLFDAARKRPLPFLPRVVGLVCGRAGAAEHDVVETARARWPGVEVAVRQVAVQGPTAASQVAAAVAALDRDPAVDVIVVARGGGSLEDLLPFSNEALLRAVAACRTPVVSAIGHEVDGPLLDLVADVRASTPTDAGRRVVPAVTDELAGLRQATARLRRAVAARVDGEQRRLDEVLARPVLARPAEGLDRLTDDVDVARDRLRRALAVRVDRSEAEVAGLLARVRSLSPEQTLRRGYAVVQTPGGHVVGSVAEVGDGDDLVVRLADGRLAVVVRSREPAPAGSGGTDDAG